MTDIKTKTKKVDDAYWRAQTNIPDIYTKGRVRFAAGLREVVFQLQYYNTSEGEDMILNARDILDLCDELENIEND